MLRMSILEIIFLQLIKMKKLNKRGTDKILSVYWFAILVIIAGAVVAMVSLFYGAPYDVREIEANIMINQISDCLSEEGKLSQELFSNNSFNEEFSILDTCKITFETEKTFNNEEQYYLEINFYNLNNEENAFKISQGNSNFKADCEIESENYERLVKCVSRDFYSLDSLSNVYKINILSVIRKTEKNVK